MAVVDSSFHVLHRLIGSRHACSSSSRVQQLLDRQDSVIFCCCCLLSLRSGRYLRDGGLAPLHQVFPSRCRTLAYANQWGWLPPRRIGVSKARTSSLPEQSSGQPHRLWWALQRCGQEKGRKASGQTLPHSPLDSLLVSLSASQRARMALGERREKKSSSRLRSSGLALLVPCTAGLACSSSSSCACPSHPPLSYISRPSRFPLDSASPVTVVHTHYYCSIERHGTFPNGAADPPELIRPVLLLRDSDRIH